MTDRSSAEQSSRQLRHKTISVVIPCYNAAGTIAASLRAVASSTLKPIEIVCVDDGSQDATWQTIESVAAGLNVPIRALRSEINSGAAAARNKGASIVEGSILVFVDADVCVRADTLINLRQRLFGTPSPAVLAPYSRSSGHGGDRMLETFQTLLARSTFEGLDEDDVRYFGTQCAMLYRKVFQQVGGFDSSFAAASVEDLEFGVRLRDRGHRIILARDAEIVHHKTYSLASFTANYFVKASQLARLGCVADSRAIGIGTGYASTRNIISALVLAALNVVAIVAVTSAHWLAALAAVVIGHATLVLAWREFLLDAKRDGGWRTGAAFLFLRQYVTLVGAVGGAYGMLSLAVETLKRDHKP